MATYYVSTTGNDSTGDGSSGNPYATPGKASGVASASGDVIALKSGTYTVTTATANVAGGVVSLQAGVSLVGYGATVGDFGTPPVISAGSVGSITIVTHAGGYFGLENSIINVTADGNNQTSVVGFDLSPLYSIVCYRCQAFNCTSRGFLGSASTPSPILCLCYNCAVSFYGFVGLAYCAAHSGSYAGAGSGFGVGSVFSHCIAYNCYNGFDPGYPILMVNCTAHANSQAGIDMPFDIATIVNCLLTNNGTYGLKNAGGTTRLNANNAYYANTSGKYNTFDAYIFNEIVLSGDPYANAAGAAAARTYLDLAAALTPNNTAGAGAALRGLGVAPYGDVGAIQHQDSGGGGSAGGGTIIGSPIVRGLGRVA